MNTSRILLVIVSMENLTNTLGSLNSDKHEHINYCEVVDSASGGIHATFLLGDFTKVKSFMSVMYVG